MNEIESALRRAYALGEKYWQQADSDFARDQRKADETQAKFNQLVESMQGWLSPAEADNLRTRLAEVEKQRDYAIHQAQIWKLEAASQKATVAECYQICTGATGEPGDWDGAEPVRALKAQLVEAQKDAARYSWLRMNRLWLKANLPTIAAPDFDATIDAAIDAAKGPA